MVLREDVCIKLDGIFEGHTDTFGGANYFGSKISKLSTIKLRLSGNPPYLYILCFFIDYMQPNYSNIPNILKENETDVMRITSCTNKLVR